MVKAKKKKTGAGPGLQYQGYTKDDAEKDAEELERSRNSRYIRIRPGKNVFRVVPARPGGKWKRVTYRHFVDVPGVGTVSFTCPRYETKGKRKCESCDDERKLRATNDKVDAKRADRIQAQRKVLINVVDRNDEEAGPRVLEVGRGIDKDMVEMKKFEDVDFVDPIKGSDLIIVKTGEGRQGTRYKTKEGKECKLHASRAVMQDWIDTAVDLDSVVELDSDEDIAAKLRGEFSRDRDDSDRKNSRRKKPADEDDDEDDLDAYASDDDDEEDDEDEDDEEIEI